MPFEYLLVKVSMMAIITEIVGHVRKRSKESWQCLVILMAKLLF